MDSSHSISQSDEELWAKIKKGQKDPFRALFLRYYDSLFNYGLSVCAEEEIIEDCLQELFYQIWKGRSSLSDVQNVKGYLWISFRRRLMKQIKKRHSSRKGSVQFNVNMKKVMSIERAIIDEEKQQQNRLRLQQVFDDLSHREREVLFLKYYEGMSYSEIGTILDIEYQTVRNYMYRAIDRLRKSFKKEGFKIALSIFLILIV